MLSKQRGTASSCTASTGGSNSACNVCVRAAPPAPSPQAHPQLAYFSLLWFAAPFLLVRTQKQEAKPPQIWPNDEGEDEQLSGSLVLLRMKLSHFKFPTMLRMMSSAPDF